MTDFGPRPSRRELLRAGALLAGRAVSGGAFARPSALLEIAAPRADERPPV